MRSITHAEFLAELKAQGVNGKLDYAFVCPLCKTVQSARDLPEDRRDATGFSCVGRFTTPPAAEPRKEPDGKPCNWTLGGLFRLHDLEVVTPDGKAHPFFEPATPEQAKAHQDDL